MIESNTEVEADGPSRAAVLQQSSGHCLRAAGTAALFCLPGSLCERTGSVLDYRNKATCISTASLAALHIVRAAPCWADGHGDTGTWGHRDMGHWGMGTHGHGDALAEAMQLTLLYFAVPPCISGNL